MEKPKSVMYVPLYYSNLYKSVPDGEDVIYSLYYKVSFKEAVVEAFKMYKFWHTHLLITARGLYFGWYNRKKGPRVKFINWSMIKKINGSTIKIKKLPYKLKPKRERNFETWRSYRNRNKEISANLQNLLLQGIKINLNEQSKRRELEKGLPEPEIRLLQLMERRKNMREKYRFEPGVHYVDIKEGKLRNQMHALLLDLPFIELAIILFIVDLSLSRFYSYLNISTLVILMICLGFIGFHRLIVKYYNYKLPQRDDFSLKDEKSLLHYLDYKEKSLGIGIKKEKGIELYNNVIAKKDEELLKKYKERIEKYKERIEKHQQRLKKMREERLQKYYETIDELLEMNVNEWKQYLEKNINGIKKSIESGLDYFEKKKSLQTHNIYHLSSLEDKLEDSLNFPSLIKRLGFSVI